MTDEQYALLVAQLAAVSQRSGALAPLDDAQLTNLLYLCDAVQEAIEAERLRRDAVYENEEANE